VERACSVCGPDAISGSYYDVNQSVVVNQGTPIASATSVAALKPYDLGAQLGTTSYQFIKDTIQPTRKPSVFPSNTGAVQVLKNKQIDGLVVDLPTALYVTAVQVPNSKVLGQFPMEPGGQQQRVAIVRALAMRPELMLLDEVTSALDPELVAEVLNVIRELAGGGMTMLIATHELGFARDIGNRVCFLDDGLILEQGLPQEIFANPKEPRTQQFLERIIEAGRL
jgi:ABC-type amino acid transport substrate-binding protein